MPSSLRRRSHTPGSEPPPGSRRPGGRTERNRRAVASAALALLRRGETDLSPARVAAEAGISRSTVYRRWPGAADLIREALTLHTRSLRAPDTGAFESDLRSLARRLARFFSDPAEIAMSTAMAAHADADFNAWQIDYWEPLAGELTPPFQRAIERGEIAPDHDPGLLLEMLVDPMVVRTVIMKKPLEPRFVRDLASQVIRLATAGHEPADRDADDTSHETSATPDTKRGSRTRRR